MKIFLPTIIAACCLTSGAYAAGADSTHSTIQRTSSSTLAPMEPYSITQGGCFTSMADAENYARSAGNACTNTTTARTCYVQLMVNTNNPTSTANTLRCPVGYDPLLSFGTEIVDASNSARKLVYTPADTRTRVNQNEYNFYSAQTQSYECRDYDREQVRYTTTDSGQRAYYDAARAVTVAPSSPPGPGISVGNWDYINGQNVRITRVWRTDQVCMDLSGNRAPGESYCRPGTAAAGSFYRAYWTIGGYPQQCTRPAGFYDSVNNPEYPLPAASNTYSPTTVICGKAEAGWKPINSAPRINCSTN